jgi:hypothetical protein
VAKIFKPHYSEYRTIELKWLSEVAKVQELQGRVTQLASPEQPERVLLLKPIGYHFAYSEEQHLLTRHKDVPMPAQQPLQYVRVTPELLAELVETLKIMHSKLRVVHRDISATNMFRTADHKVNQQLYPSFYRAPQDFLILCAVVFERSWLCNSSG